ncbi:MAG: hypothetical protein PHU23_08740 [Dehalococcoidales bacterium]|nr:hypothetical protein [Dehalococcoidales bacterium]
MTLENNSPIQLAIVPGDVVINPSDYRIGDFVLFEGDGPAFTVLSWMLGNFSEEWRNLPYKPWHVGFISHISDVGTVWVCEAKGGEGITESNLFSFKEPYLVFRWFDSPPDPLIVKAFIDEYRGEKYDAFWGYAFVILWYGCRRWPLIIDYNWMCWEWLWFFAMTFGKPITNIHKYPFLPLLLDKLHYPGWSRNRCLLPREKIL